MSELTLSKKKLEGKVTIITGGASGVCEATAYLFALHGARALIIADIQEEKVHQVASSIGSDRCTFINCDVTNEHQVKSLVESTVQIHGQLDIMFCNAGILSTCGSEQNILGFDLEACDALFTTQWLNIDYFKSKHAVLGLVRSATACKDLGAYGIRVNYVSPSAVLSVRCTPDYCQYWHHDVGGKG
ncbi:hypothetical protein LguiA_007328 [Lonicera macranthoides]